MSPIFSNQSKPTIARLHESLPHALLLSGIEGIGLLSTARYLAQTNLATIIQPTNTDGEIDLSPKGVIRLLQIHELQAMTRGKRASQQVFIIDNADAMNNSAQNAFLKLLEEPVQNLSFILTSHHIDSLLLTIRSRVQHVALTPLSSIESRHFITSSHVKDATKITQLLFLGQGRPAELTRLIHDDNYFAAQAGLLADAQALIKGTPIQRCTIVTKYYRSRPESLALVRAARTVVMHSLSDRPSQSLINLAARLETLYRRIIANGNIRLQLTQFVIE